MRLVDHVSRFKAFGFAGISIRKFVEHQEEAEGVYGTGVQIVIAIFRVVEMKTARYAGISVGLIKFMLFAITGLMAGLAAALLTSRAGSTRPNIALGWELEVITMLILGGFSIAGGQGRITGAVMVVLIIGFATLALSLVNVPGIVISVLSGVMLIATIAHPLAVRMLAKGGAGVLQVRILGAFRCMCWQSKKNGWFPVVSAMMATVCHQFDSEPARGVKTNEIDEICTAR